MSYLGGAAVFAIIGIVCLLVIFAHHVLVGTVALVIALILVLLAILGRGARLR